jgi:hypothetical protein
MSWPQHSKGVSFLSLHGSLIEDFQQLQENFLLLFVLIECMMIEVLKKQTSTL